VCVPVAGNGVIECVSLSDEQPKKGVRAGYLLRVVIPKKKKKNFVLFGVRHSPANSI